MRVARPAAALPACVTHIEGHAEALLEEGWQLCRCPAGAFADPDEVDTRGSWVSPTALSTVAGAVEGTGWDTLDDSDFWLRRSLPATEGHRGLLEFGGLATLATVFVDGREVLSSESMFARHVIELLEPSRESTLHVHIAALAPVLKQRRSRPRWLSRIVSSRNLRFIRTSMLGRMPGIFPRPAPVGLFKPVRLVTQSRVAIDAMRVRSSLDGDVGRVRLETTVCSLGDEAVTGAVLRVGAGEQRLDLAARGPGRYALRGELELRAPQRWWPHTHGEPTLYPASLVLELAGGPARVDLRPVAFRDIERTGGDVGFGLSINGEPIFARGACWMPPDPITFRNPEGEQRRALEMARDAGMNMLRLSGITAYESSLFHDLCDQFGILVWQDFMFANLDYPADDASFMQLVRAEVEEVLEQLADRPSTAVLCGNSEAEQQAAMLGLSSAQRTQPLFDDVMRQQCEQYATVPYWPSTPHGGVLPFRTDTGTTHYFGVGAYHRSLDSLRTARVRFSPECLAFSQVPEDAALEEIDGQDALSALESRAGVPRDVGASWDFADVTDGYVERTFGADVRALRDEDPARYVALSRRVPGMLMSQAHAIWRRQADDCQGALIWTLRDLQAGCGWGLIAHDGSPKAAYYALERVWAPRALFFVDDGLNGLSLFIANDHATPWAGCLQLRILRASGKVLESDERNLEVAPRGQLALDVEELLGRFVDAAYAYRFGPPDHLCVWARLKSDAGVVEASHFVGPQGSVQEPVGLVAELTQGTDGYEMTVSSERVARSVRVAARGFMPTDNYFDVMPHSPRVLSLLSVGGDTAAPRGSLGALGDPSSYTLGEP